MAKRLSLLKLRTDFQFSQAQAAEALGMPIERLAAIEKSPASATVAEIRDLAIFYERSAEQLTGVDAPERLFDYPFALNTVSDRPFGTLRLAFKDHSVEYPIDWKVYANVTSSMAEMEIQSDESSPSYLHAWTMDNRIVFARTDALFQLDLIDDNVEAMPPFEHPEVYQAIEVWELDDHSNQGPVLKARVEAVFDDQGSEKAIQSATHSRIVYPGGAETWHHLLTGEESLGYFTLELEGSNGFRSARFLPVGSPTDGQPRYVNLSQAELIEVPANRYYRTNHADE